uniref:Uncharacterized protein n=1 Tax=Siphoviridae sp. ctxdc10 TaxID=2825740 RepID=A0A8S5TSL9_9CAUD|nr:MAG TPA: hypothetical protein [Siphoviridae sp. ctxdc10]
MKLAAGGRTSRGPAQDAWESGRFGRLLWMHSSAGQSSRLITGRSEVRILLRPRGVLKMSPCLRTRNPNPLLW